jgi:hypothetical protein
LTTEACDFQRLNLVSEQPALPLSGGARCSAKTKIPDRQIETSVVLANPPDDKA